MSALLTVFLGSVVVVAASLGVFLRVSVFLAVFWSESQQADVIGPILLLITKSSHNHLSFFHKELTLHSLF